MSRSFRLGLGFALVVAGIAGGGDSAVLGTPDPQGYTIFPDKTKQKIWGIGFEIQSDSIGSGNNGLPEKAIAVPRDLVPAEQSRLAKEMLRGFRYCRLAAGLYWRGIDEEQKTFRPRWPEQLDELRVLLSASGVEGLSLEYWSPAPFWKGNRVLVGSGEKDPRNQLRCFAPGFAEDPVYHGDIDRFLVDFAAAAVADIRTLKAAGFKLSMWGLQNEPFISNGIYPTCSYPAATNYVRAYRAVAGAVRREDPGILLFGDTEEHFPGKIAAGMGDPEVASLVDAYVVHTIGTPSESVRSVHERIRRELPYRPWFQNEYEYLSGGATPDRCLNTVQHIMNSFQLGENPTWFWIHALKPMNNSEASGYALGFWHSLGEPNPRAAAIKPGHWIFNPYNWHAVGSFIRHMPWDCVAVDLYEEQYDADGRIFAFRRPNGRLTVVVSNRSDKANRGFVIATGIRSASWKGFRYTPQEAGPDTMGVPVGERIDTVLRLDLPPRSWEFWEQQ